MNYRNLLAVLLLAALACAAQPASPGAKQAAKTTAAAENPASTEPELDTQAMVRETELVDTRPHKLGVFWWVPTDFWEAAVRKQGYSSESARNAFEPFRRYNVFIIAVGDLDLGNASWAKEQEIRKSVLLRDQRGNKYKPLEEVPNDVGLIVELMKPVLKNMMGNFGEGLQFMLFPAKDSAGSVFADPRKSSEIFLDVSDLMGTPMKTYSWRLPLSSVMPKKYCPVGKEKVEANWKYCPWHGNKLEGEADTVSAPQTKF